MIINLIRLVAFNAVLLLLLFYTSGCETAAEQRAPMETIKIRPLSSYNLDEKLLSEGDSLKLLYASWDTNDESMDQENYIQVVALKLASGDTVNILTGFETKFTQEDGDRIFVYQKYDRDFQPVIAQQKADFLANKDKLQDPEEVEKMANELAQSRDNIYKYHYGPAVYVDGSMDEEFDNQFPVTIGKLRRL